jgi:FixJ family two-component response regulator
VEQNAAVFIVDDDLPVSTAISRLVRSVGLSAHTFSSAAEFLARLDPRSFGCVVLDVRLPGVSGLELQSQLLTRAPQLPIIFVSAHGDVSMTVRAMRAGAIDFLTKPFRDQDLLDAVARGLAQARAVRQEEREVERLGARFDALTPRERQVLEGVVAGKLNKQIALELGISEVTVKIHRGQVMQKTGANHVADLVRMSTRVADRSSPPSPRLRAREY